jgi:protein-tyrosine-phosphatase
MEKKTTLGDIMWFDILKDSKQVSRTMGSIDWENEEIPDTQEEDCLQWVKDFNKLIEKFDFILDLEGMGRWEIVALTPKDNETVCRVLEEIKQLSTKGWDFNEDNYHKLGEERDWNAHLDTSKGVSYRFQYYDGDGYQAVLEIIKDGEHIVDSTIDGHSSEPFNNFFRRTLRSWDGKSSMPNPEYKGKKMDKEMDAILRQINEHFQKILPSVSRYHRDRF